MFFSTFRTILEHAHQEVIASTLQN
jgi:hypothetical protein